MQLFSLNLEFFVFLAMGVERKITPIGKKICCKIIILYIFRFFRHTNRTTNLSTFPVIKILRGVPKKQRKSNKSHNVSSSESNRMSRKTSVGSWGICLQLGFFGSQATGKASLIHQVIGNGFVEREAKENMHLCAGKALAIPGLPNALIMDTNDLHHFPPMRRVALQRANIFVLVFSADREASVRTMKDYYRDIIDIKYKCTDYHNNRIPIVVVANKCDIAENMRSVDLDNVKRMVVKEWGCRFVEVSALTGSNINELKRVIHEETRLSYNVLISPSSSKKKKLSISGRFKVLVS